MLYLLNRFLITLFLFIFSSLAYAAETNKNNSLDSQIQNIVNKNQIKYNLPAISVSIKSPDNNKIKNYVSGYYSSAKKKTITPDTLFQIGSITKTFTSSILFKLIEEHKLNLNDKVTKWLPQYSRWKNITINNLLFHTSGIYNYTSGKSFDALLRKSPHKLWTSKELVDMAYHHRDLFIPGKKFNYTNTDYILLGIIIEKASHKPIQRVFNDYLKSYKLSHTYYTPAGYPNVITNQIAHGYNRDGTFSNNTDVTFVSESFGQSAGAMTSTPNDLIKWLKLLFNGKIISYPSLTKMTQVIANTNAKQIDFSKLQHFKKSKSAFKEVGLGAGIGLVYFKHNGFTWVHSGGTLGYESLYAYNPCNGIYLTMTYSVKPKQQLIFIKIADEIFKTLNSSATAVNAFEKYRTQNKYPKYCIE